MHSAAEIREAYGLAADFFVGMARLVPADAWERPGLGVWTVRALTGHASRALTTVEAYLDAPVARVDLAGPADYFLAASAAGASQVGGAAQIAERGRLAGAALGDDPAGAVRAAAMRVVARVDREPDDAILGTPVGGMRLIDYLPTRILELTIHTLDLAAAIGREAEPPGLATEVTFEVVASLARRRGQAGALLLAATGRGPLPAGFSVLGV